MDIPAWLSDLGLEQYVPAFRDNGIDDRVLPDLTADDLKDLGITMVGHRRILLKAISCLREPALSTVASEPPPATPNRERQAAAEAERRQITVMFCDLVGSTALSARLDPEDLREVIGRYHACVAQTVGRFDGFVAKYMGDGVLIYFGYPYAHEDDAEQAVRAGLALVDAVGELQTRERLRVRVGIATGLVVVGDLIGAGSAQEQAIVGETPNLAARLQALAEPGAVMIADSTRRQIGALFDILDLGPQSLKGFAMPQRPWRALAENRAVGRFEALRSRATPLVGRDEELELLLRRWVQAKSGSGRVVLISGEPGVGKSRLAEAFAEYITGEPHIRLRYFCSPHHQDSALHPVIAQVERAAGFGREDTPDAKLVKLRALMAPAGTGPEDLALIAELHGLPAADLAPALDVTPQKKKEKTFDALLRHLAGLVRQQPVLIVFEDIHWIDPSSRELLDRMLERVADWPVLLLATFRPEFTPPWAGQPHVTILTLARLDRHDTGAMIENLAGNQALPPGVVQEIAERTDGVPLFVEELTKAVLESGEASAALATAPHATSAVPATLHASLMARLDRLGPTAKDVAQKGAVIGREFGYDLLSSIADLTDAQLRDALGRLANSRLVFARGTPPESSYVFKHALVQDAAYGTLLRSRRQELHRKIVAELEVRFPEIASVQPELLAHHLTEGGRIERAIEFWLKAGQHALARSAMAEAVALLRKGLALIPNLSGNVSHQERELELQIASGWALMQAKGYASPEADQAYARARQLCEQLNRPAQLVPVLWGQFMIRLVRIELQQLWHDAEEIRRLGEASNDVPLEFLGCRFGGSALFGLGELAIARARLERSLALSDDRSLHSILSAEPLKEGVLLYLSRALCCLGYFDQARQRIDELRPDTPAARAIALVANWDFGWLTGSEPSLLLQHADELLSLSVEQGFTFWCAVGLLLRGSCLAATGRAQEGVAQITLGLTEYRATGASTAMSLALTELAEADGIAGQPLLGLERIAEALQFCGPGKERSFEAETHRIRGELLIAAGDPTAAEASLQEALALAREQSAKLWELRAAMSLGRLWRDQARFGKARDLLAPVYAWFTEGFDSALLKEAKALLDELEGLVCRDSATASPRS